MSRGLCIPLLPDRTRVTLVDQDIFWVFADAQMFIARSPKEYVGVRVGKLWLHLHKLILQVPPGMTVDHMNGDGLDNRRANLRAATQQQNTQNRRKPRGRRGKPPTSGYKGVSWFRDHWESTIRIEGRGRRLGKFAVEIEAAMAYDAAAREHFGAFACVNFPRLGEQGALAA